jgi:hypothetical protein
MLFAAGERLGIERRELNGGWRLVDPAAIRGTPSSPQNQNIELYFHDTLAGGAGFSVQMCDDVDSTGEWQIIPKAREILSCRVGRCDSACTHCLQSTENRPYHNILDRHWAQQLLEYIETGNRPQIDRNRSDDIATNILPAYYRDRFSNNLTVRHVADDIYEFTDNQTAQLPIQSILAQPPPNSDCITDWLVRTNLPEALDIIHRHVS